MTFHESAIVARTTASAGFFDFVRITSAPFANNRRNDLQIRAERADLLFPIKSPYVGSSDVAEDKILASIASKPG
jgi:hypothetical protein